MTWGELFWVGIGAVFVGSFVLAWRSYKRMYLDLPTFDEYGRQHPDLVQEGRCQCSRCGGHRIFVHNLDPDRRRHICSTCGSVLYRS